MFMIEAVAKHPGSNADCWEIGVVMNMKGIRDIDGTR